MHGHLDDLSPQMVFVDETLRREHNTTLSHYLAGARASGKSYENIAKHLEDLISVSGFTITYGSIRRWCKRLAVDQKAAS